jgi:hypothetical protein
MSIAAFLAGFVAFATAHALADRAQIELVLGEMEKAVLAGDAAAYLKHVDVRDPVFRKEQENWAADLKLHVPAMFDLEIVEAAGNGASAPAEPSADTEASDDDDKPPSPERRDEKTATFWENRAEFTLRMSWHFDEANTAAGGSKKRSVEYPVSFERADDDAWVYLGERWITIEQGAESASPAVEPGTSPKNTLRVRVRAPEGFDAAARAVADVLPGIREVVEQEFGVTNSTIPEVKLYPTMAHLQASIYLSYVDGLSGWNEPHESIKILARRRMQPANLRPLLGHEYGHVATFLMGEHINKAPWWILEGTAELAAARWSVSPEDAVNAAKKWAADGELADWNDLADFRTVDRNKTRYVYRQGQAMMTYITTTYGSDKRNAWLRELAAGKTIDEASKTVFEQSFGELDAAWRASLSE